MIGKRDLKRIKDNSFKLFEISKQIKILRYLAWDKSVRAEFFHSKSETIPKVDYPKFDSGELRFSLKTKNKGYLFYRHKKTRKRINNDN